MTNVAVPRRFRNKSACSPASHVRWEETADGGTDARLGGVLIDWNPMSAELGEYKHFMQKEIFEQARALTDTVRGRIDFETGEVTLPDLTLTAEDVANINRITTAACGTSAYSALIGKFLIEELTGLAVMHDPDAQLRARLSLLVLLLQGRLPGGMRVRMARLSWASTTRLMLSSAR